MPASDYVNAYLQLWCWVNDTFTAVRVRNYLQSGATRAANEYSKLLSSLPKVAASGAGKPLPAVFEVQGEN